MKKIHENQNITIDGVDYAKDDLSDAAVAQIASIQFSDERILQLKNELAISNKARSGYLSAIKAEFLQKDKTDE